MPRLEFVGQSERDDDNRQGNTSRLVNLYRERLGTGGKSQTVLKCAPRANDFATMPQIFVRDMHEIGGMLYVMAGDTLYRVSALGAVTTLGATVSEVGAEIFGAEDNKVCTVSGGRYFVWDGATMSEPTAGAFSSFGTGAFFGNYVLLGEKNGRRFQWSDLADSETLPGLNFATAESTDTNILRIVPVQGRVMIFKRDVIEQWAVTGQSGANAFSLLPGGVVEVGLRARGLLTRFTGGVFFVGSNGIAYLHDGTQAAPISIPAVNTAIDQSNPTHCLVYEDEGHIFCAIRFKDRPAWVYDIATGEWSERASGDDRPWNLTVSAKAYGQWFGGVVTGEIYRMGRTGTDEGGDFIRTSVSSTLYNEGRRFRVSMVEFTGRMGQGEIDDVSEPKLMIRFSGDGGRRYGRELTRDLGGVGEFGQLCRVRNVGSFRQLCAEIKMSDARDIPIDGSANVVIA